MSTIIDEMRSRRPPTRSPQQQLFDSVAPWQVRADLRTFFGPGAETYLEVYDKMRAAEPNRRLAVRTWSWPVFFGAFTWFFYRKMYVVGATVIFTPIIMSYLLGQIGGGGTWILFTVSAKSWYVNSALGRIAKADALGLTGPERTEYLQRAGGVSLPAGIFAGAIYGLLVAFIILAVATRHKMGHA